MSSGRFSGTMKSMWRDISKQMRSFRRIKETAESSDYWHRCIHIHAWLCIHACICVCMYVCMNVCMSELWKRQQALVFIRTGAYIHTYAYVYMYVYVDVCIYACSMYMLYLSMCVCVYIYIYMLFIHAYINACTRAYRMVSGLIKCPLKTILYCRCNDWCDTSSCCSKSCSAQLIENQR